MPAPAAGAANGLAVLGRASRPQQRPPMHWKRPCAQIWSIWSPVSCRWQAGGSSTSMLPEHGQLMKYDVQDTSTSSCTHGSATGMIRWQPLCRICTRLHATRAERAAEATSARVASTGTAESGSSCCSQLVSYHSCAVSEPWPRRARRQPRRQPRRSLDASLDASLDHASTPRRQCL